jgi:uncharacterized membrane protein
MRRSHLEIGATAAVAISSSGVAVVDAPTPVTTIFGLALLISLGYVWVKVLLGRNVVGLERAAVAVGLTISAAVLGGLLLQAVGVPLHRRAWTGLFADITLVGDVILIFQYLARPQLAADVQPAKWRLPAWRLPVRQTVIYGLAGLVAMGAVALADIGAAVQHYPGFTQLWLSPRAGGATDASLGVSNHQGRTEEYRLTLIRNGHISATWQLALANGQEWQQTVAIESKHDTVANLYLLPDLAHPYRYVQVNLAKAFQE